VEIVRGPYSALYGANAVSGVVNIITKDQPQEPQTSAATLFGTYRTSISRISNGLTYQNSGYLFNSNYKSSQGHRDNSQHHSTNNTLRFNYRDDSRPVLNLPLNITVDMGYYQGDTNFPGAQPAADTTKRTASQSALGNNDASTLLDYAQDTKTYFNAVLAMGDFKLRGSANNWDYQNHQEWIATNRITQDSRYRTDSSVIELTYNRPVAKSRISGGLTAESQEYNVNSPQTDTVTQAVTPQKWDARRTISSAFLQDEITLGRTVLTLGGRTDNPNDFAGQFSGRANVLYQLTPSVNLRASYGDSYRAPSLNDLYWPPDAFAEGNRNLKAEQGRTVEAGINYTIIKGVTAKANIFRQNLDNMIAWAPTGTMGPWGNRWAPTNLNQANTTGFELEGTADLIQNLSLKLNYTLLDATQKNQELTDAALNTMETKERKLAYAPPRKLDFTLSHKNLFGVENLMFDFGLQYTSETYQYYSDYNAWPAVTTLTKSLPGYWLSGLKIRRSTKGLELFLGIDNLTNKEYAAQFGSSIDDRDYPMPGRSYTAGLNLKF
jgi:outer membrane receptor protein involved in Fe transport